MRTGKRVQVVLLAILLGVAVFSGCWDLEEAEKLGIVLSMGFGRLPGGELRLTAQVSNPSVVGVAPVMGGITPGASISSK